MSISFEEDIFVDEDFELEEDEIQEEEEEDIDEEEEDDEEDEDAEIIIDKKELRNRKMLPVLYRYEKAMIIAERAEMIDAQDDTTMPEEVEKLGLTSSIDIAKLEFENKKLPDLTIYRYIRNGKYEKWKLSEMNYFL